MEPVVVHKMHLIILETKIDNEEVVNPPTWVVEQNHKEFNSTKLIPPTHVKS